MNLEEILKTLKIENFDFNRFKESKYFLPGLALGALVVVLIISFVVAGNSNKNSVSNNNSSTKPTPTSPYSSSSNYTNNIFNYSLSYPPGYLLYQQIQDGSVVQFRDKYVTLDQINSSPIKPFISVTCTNNVNFGSLNGWLTQYAGNTGPDFTVISQSNLTIGKYSVIQVKRDYVSPISGHFPMIDSIFQFGTKICDVEDANFNGSFNQSQIKIENVFLNSFKFNG